MLRRQTVCRLCSDRDPSAKQRIHVLIANCHETSRSSSDTVCFIAKSKAKATYRATGFVVSVAGAHGNAHLYLVTAKHVANSVASEPFIIGFNTTQGTKGRFEVNYDPAFPHRWGDHPTEPNAVDVAVFPFAPSEYHLLEVEWIHYPNMFATPEIIDLARNWDWR